MANQFHVLPLSVHDLATGFAAVAKSVAAGAHVDLVVASGVPNLSLKVSVNGDDIEKSEEFKTFTSNTAAHPFIQATSGSIRASNFTVAYKTDNSSSFFTLEDIKDSEGAFRTTDALGSHFNVMNRATVLASSLPPEQREVMRYREQAVADLEAQVNRLGVFLTEMAEKNATLIQRMTTDLQQKYQEQSAELDEEARKKREQLGDERAAFERQKAEFNDRARTHVRRDLLEKIQKNITDRATAKPVTAGVSKSRLLIHIVTGITILASIAAMLIAGAHVYEAAGQKPFDWRVVPPFTLAAAVFVGTLIFYFRWISRWADRLAHSDIAVSQYASDILAASWIAELLFEYKDEQGKEIPAEVLTSLTEGLFKREEFRGASYHPSDDVLTLVRRLRTFEAGPQGVKIVAGKK